MNDLGLSLIGASARVTALALFGLVLAFALKRRGPSAVMLATFWTLSGLVAVSLLSLSPWPRFWAVDFDAQPVPAAQGAPAPTAGALPHATAPAAASLEQGASDTRLADFVREFQRASRNPGPTPAAAGTVSGWRWPAWILLGVLIGIGLALARLAFALRSVGNLQRRGDAIVEPLVLEEVDCLRAALGCVPSVELRECAQLTTAATVGWRRPVILLPAGWRGWTDEERRAALAHELAHVRAGDYGSGLWAHLCLCVHIYHPLAHWLVARLRLEQELAADALAARVSGGSRPYLESLARLALRRPGPIESRPMAGLWPARPFLPTRGTLLRRIEMLRNPRSNPPRTDALPWLGRALTITALTAAGLVLAGVRGPDGSARAQAQPAEKPPGAQGAASDAYDLSHAPAETILAVVAKPSTLLARPEFKPVADLVRPEAGSMFKALGVSPDEIETVVVLLMRGFEVPAPQHLAQAPPLVFTLRAVRPFDWKMIKTTMAAEPAGADFEDLQIVRSKATGSAFVKFDDRTLAVGPERIVRQVIAARNGGPINHVWDAAWLKVKKGQATLAVDAVAFAALVPKDGPPGGPRANASAIAAMGGPLLEKASAYGLGIDVDKTLSLDLVATTPSNEAATEVAETLKALVVLGKNSMESARRQVPANQERSRVALAMLDVVELLLKNAKAEVNHSVVELQSVSDVNVARLVAPLAPAIVAARAAARHAQSMNNMKQIGLAMFNYKIANNHLPPAVLLGKDGKTPHSWRVAILPYLEEQELYKQYHFDEPWDSNANRLVLAKMPAVYRHPTAGPNETSTAYVVPVNADSIFPPGGTGTNDAQILDGISNTILAVEANTAIPWTKPEDLTLDGDLKRFDAPAPQVPAYYTEGFLTLVADGSVRFISSANPAATLRALFTRASGEVLDWSSVLPAPGQPPSLTPARIAPALSR